MRVPRTKSYVELEQIRVQQAKATKKRRVANKMAKKSRQANR